MNWDDLRVFLTLCREGTFAAAARHLEVNPTTVARRLATLEQAVGAQLFTRTRDGLVPTASADEMRPPAELVERQLKAIERSVGGGDARLAGNVRLNLTHNLAANFLVEHLGAFRRRHPDIVLQMCTTNVMVDLTLGTAELVIRHRSPGTGTGVESSGHIDIVAKRLAPIGWAVFASRAYLERAGLPRSSDDVAGHDAILPLDDAMYLPGSQWAQSVAEQLRTPLRSDSPEAMLSGCIAGFGLCVLPCFPRVYRSNLVRISDTIDMRDTWLLMPSDLRRVARVRALWDYVDEVFEQWGPLLSGEVTPAKNDARQTT